MSGNAASDIDLSTVSTDSRAIKKGEFFLALNGPNFRGSDFLEDAFRKGAAGAIVESAALLAKYKNKIVISVEDTTKALQDIAASNRAKFKIPVICVTGSNGKTTVKDMIAAVLAARYNLLKNEGTKNNHIGVPQTLLKLKKEHELCVLELGTNHRGEIKALSAVAKPTVAVVTNIGPSHLEYLIDLDGVYEEKKQLLESLKSGGVAVVNGDDPFLSKANLKRRKVLRYGLKKSNDFRAEDICADAESIRFRVNGRAEFELKLLGAHNVCNALAAIAVASIFNVNARAAKRALLRFKPASMRLDPLNVKGISVINDSYNSNPLSMKTALEAIGACQARAKWVVSGDMLELGGEAVRFHEMAGELVAMSGANGLITFGKFSRHTLSGASACGMNRDNLWHCDTHEEIAKVLKRVTRAGDIVLIKGSRGMKMERVIEKMKG